MLRGTPVSPGLVIGRAHRVERKEDGPVPAHRVSAEESHQELNRFRAALDRSREQVLSLKQKLSSSVPADDLRILDVHLAYLNDPIFVTDVENRVLNDNLNLEAAIDRVLWDFSRILKLVENEYIRERAHDLSDVALRVLRNLAPAPAGAGAALPEGPIVLVTRELTVTDMFLAPSEAGGAPRVVAGVIAEEGGITSHAAILARSMGIPCVSSLRDLAAQIAEGEELVVDGTEGIVRVRPDEAVKAEYAQPKLVLDAAPAAPDEEWVRLPMETRDGTAVEISGTCGNLNDVERAMRGGLSGVGMYRTELLFLVDREAPDEEDLTKHYISAAERAQGKPVTFRLLDLQSDVRPDLLHGGEREPNPALGLRSIRALAQRRDLLRLQLRAILRAAHQRAVRLLIPFVLDVGDVRLVRDLVREEREDLRKRGIPHAPKLEGGVVLEIPAAFLGVRRLIDEVDFLAIGVDNFIQYLLAADRKNKNLRSYFAHLHPSVLRAITKVAQVASGQDKRLVLFGEVASRPENLPLFLGCGVREFSISPIAARVFRETICTLSITDAQKLAIDYADQDCIDPDAIASALKHRFE
ncbi:MAG: phosphoenolpyruvate--protein phosphotransferase [Planctomycetes bacterium]|nr:phosphoenolpyruvate--protein phosphotransferase [Planctomycetota bacterium]